MSKLVTIYGGSGFVGRYIARRLAKEGWRVRVAVRRPNEALFVRGYGAVGQLEPVLCNIRDEASVAAAMQGADAVVNCVGVLNSLGKNKFDAVHVEGAERVARLAAAAGVPALVHISAIGADAQSQSEYARSKAEGEAAVLAAYPSAVILRPSVIFGIEDQFYNRLGGLIRMAPLVPLMAASTRMQPVHVDDVADAAARAVLGQAAPGVYELGGPDVVTLRDAAEQARAVIGRKRVFLPLPSFFFAIPATILDIVQGITFGLIANKTVTRDQQRFLAADNVVSAGAKGFADLGITPRAAAPLLEDYLWQYRPAGQYAAIKQSARNMRA
ncbi:complex I NDUFA9 subunit family protein [Falsigemmobacter intermedius]|uniref:Complex I NDUFA9 subunit family protein n=1 Tax=Falsigemmobacter intermedius TaxID=1553448 RepID=A0A3S4XWH6_9RHOB|nr:complex I NDUFA9 subunit family protein [Falsigemmobacter intermedius]RWY43190.1 complex I NDUFA9 subunit family protein [Falsigemmobacter intermedius]